MGQSSSSENVETIHDVIGRQARVIKEIANLSYQDFQNHLGELNKLSSNCMDADGRVLVFAVKRNTDSPPLLWRGTIKIACVKVDLTTKKIDTYRLLNLSQFLKVFRSIQNQFAAAQQSQSSGGTSADSSFEPPRASGTSAAVNLIHQTFEDAAKGVIQCDKLAECCICMERKLEVVLPCAHSYCLFCLEQWHMNHDSCPICQETGGAEESWIFSEIPDDKEVSEDICHSLMKLVSDPSTNGR